MNEKEKKEFYVANCMCCLLAEAMKSCALCQFNVGLEEKQTEKLSPASFSLPIPAFSSSALQSINF